jgi:hypothetical protein
MKQMIPKILSNNNSVVPNYGNEMVVFYFIGYSIENNIFLDKIKQKVLSCFESIDRISGQDYLLEYKKNSYKGLHDDAGDNPDLKYGMIYYINDNYEGGEIYYPELNLKIKPKANSLVIHPSNLLHEVFEIKSDSNRYAISMFAYKNEEVKAVLKREKRHYES